MPKPLSELPANKRVLSIIKENLIKYLAAMRENITLSAAASTRFVQIGLAAVKQMLDDGYIIYPMTSYVASIQGAFLDGRGKFTMQLQNITAKMQRLPYTCTSDAPSEKIINVLTSMWRQLVGSKTENQLAMYYPILPFPLPSTDSMGLLTYCTTAKIDLLWQMSKEEPIEAYFDI